MSRYNRTCILCGIEYKFCSNCKEESHQPAWKNIYCSENCRTIFNAITEYSMKTKDIIEVKKILESCDLSNIDNFKEGTKKAIAEIMAAEIPADPYDDPKIKDMKIIEVNPEDLENKSEEQPKKQEFIAKRSMKKSNK